VNGEYANGEYYIPLATTRGRLLQALTGEVLLLQHLAVQMFASSRMK